MNGLLLKRHFLAILLTASFAWNLAGGPAVALDDPITPEQAKFFETKIRPVLARECYSCHSTQVGAVKGGLWVDTKDGLLTGGDSGAAIVPFDLDESVLFNAINHMDYNMPPRKKLSNEIINDFKKWIEMGAPDPRVRKTAKIKSSITPEDIETGRAFWSFVPPKTTAVPVNMDSQAWAKTAIDQFVHAGRKEHGFGTPKDADAAIVLRRLTYRLVGLPPTPEQIKWLQSRWKNDREAALETIVDQLLDSPQFGERWGRHWLDVARFAESSGKERNMTYPQAWRYRDYVIDAFNSDKPYNEFLQEQIAGDLLPAKTDEEWAEHLIATGFLAMGPKTLTEQNGRQFQLDQVDEQIDVTTRVMLGVSVACARCHDHKFDPIPQTDYYALAGIFQNMTTHYGTINTFQNRRPSNLLILPVNQPGPGAKSISKSELYQYKQRLKAKQEELQDAARLRRMDRQGDGNRARNAIANIARLSSEVGSLDALVNSYDDNGDPYSYCMGVQSVDRPTDARLLERGEFDKPAQTVKRGLPQVLCSTQPRIKSKSSGRLELARWIGSDQNPLAARVMVNRIWLHLMGQGIVRTPENFGSTGLPPTHAELLDHLAIEFVKDDWSVKSIIKQIVLSRTFRMSSQYHRQNFEKDPENKWLWRYEPSRLDAEALRDSLLAASGQLDKARPHGSTVAQSGNSLIRDGNLIDLGAIVAATSSGMTSGRNGRQLFSQVQRSVKNLDEPVNHRSVYLPIVRDNIPRALEVFDFAEPTMVVGTRESSNTPDQGLYFLNNTFVISQCDAMAQRLAKKHGSVQDQVGAAFLLAYGREATRGEIQAAAKFYKSYQPNGSFRSGMTSDLKRLSAVCQAIVAAAEFRFLN